MKKFFKIFLLSMLGIIIILAGAMGVFIYKVTYGFPFYDSKPPVLQATVADFSILLFNKTNGFRHGEAIEASTRAFQQMGEKHGWSVFVTENGAVFNKQQLDKFDLVIWNNVTGRVLKEEQKTAFKEYMENGGGFLGIHGAGDNSHHWKWYEKNLLGADFSHHTMNPQFQEATMHLHCDTTVAALCHGLTKTWKRTEEWYSFFNNPADQGFKVLYTVDEKTFNPSGYIRFLAEDKDFGMGDFHPIVWYKELPGGGRTFYSALGHAGVYFEESEHLEMLRKAILWVGNHK